MKRKSIAIILLITFGVQGCGFVERFVKKPWGMGTLVPALICGAIGATSGWVIQNNRPGTSTILFQDEQGNPTRDPVSAQDNKEQWKGAAIGGAIGVVLCGMAGHYLFDPDPTPSPPPPPPPPTATPLPPVKKRIVLRGVNFDFDKNDIRPDSRPVLDEAVGILRENPDIRVSVEGHTDSVGTDAYNMALGDRRARAVYRYLFTAGIAPDRMETASFGESRPVASNDTDSGRAQNRRVELRVLAE